MANKKAFLIKEIEKLMKISHVFTALITLYTQKGDKTLLFVA